MRSMWSESEPVNLADVRLAEGAWDSIIAARDALDCDPTLIAKSIEIRFHRETGAMLVWADLGHGHGHLAVLGRNDFQWRDPLTRHCHAQKRSGIPATRRAQ